MNIDKIIMGFCIFCYLATIISLIIALGNFVYEFISRLKNLDEFIEESVEDSIKKGIDSKYLKRAAIAATVALYCFAGFYLSQKYIFTWILSQ